MNNGINYDQTNKAYQIRATKRLRPLIAKKKKKLQPRKITWTLVQIHPTPTTKGRGALPFRSSRRESPGIARNGHESQRGAPLPISAYLCSS
jgi:hypothetical protein